MIDQLAYLAGMDPYQFRLKNITDGACDGRTSGATRSSASPRRRTGSRGCANSVKQTGDIRTGRGIALGGFAGSQSGIVAEIEVNMKTGKIVAKHMYASQVAGLTVAPALVENQMSGALIMGDEPRAVRGGRVRQGPRHEPRLGHATRCSASRTARR